MHESSQKFVIHLAFISFKRLFHVSKSRLAYCDVRLTEQRNYPAVIDRQTMLGTQNLPWLKNKDQFKF